MSIAKDEDGIHQKIHWFRSTTFQVLVVGGVFFCVRGGFRSFSPFANFLPLQAPVRQVFELIRFHGQ